MAANPASSLSKHSNIFFVYLDKTSNCCVVKAVPDGEATFEYPNLFNARTSKYPSTKKT